MRKKEYKTINYDDKDSLFSKSAWEDPQKNRFHRRIIKRPQIVTLSHPPKAKEFDYSLYVK